MTDKQPWHDCPLIWRDEKAYFNWLRGSVRRIWSKHPIRINYKQSLRYKAPVGKYGKDVWVINCEMCGTPSRETQTDHIHGGYGFKDWLTFTEWSKMILWVTFDDIRELCIPCHEVVTLSQKLKLSLEDAAIEKQVIAICKKKAKEIDTWLAERHTTSQKNPTSRRNAVREALIKEKEK